MWVNIFINEYIVWFTFTFNTQELLRTYNEIRNSIFYSMFKKSAGKATHLKDTTSCFIQLHYKWMSPMTIDLEVFMWVVSACIPDYTQLRIQNTYPRKWLHWIYRLTSWWKYILGENILKNILVFLSACLMNRF